MSSRASRRGGAWLLCLASFALPACGPAPEPAALAAARLEPAAALRSDAPTRTPAGESPSRATSFEERLRRRRGLPGPEAAEPISQTVQRQTFALGADLTADLPQRFDAWSWAQDGELVLATHERNGRTDALIYARPLPVEEPAAAMNRFVYEIDPELGSEWLLTFSATGSLAAKAAVGVPLSPREIVRGLTALAGPTLGRGLGYRSDADSFTGWRWTGENEHGVHLRLGRTEGSWGPQGDLPEEARIVAESLVTEIPQLQEVLRPKEGDPVVLPTPAFLLIGSATHRGRTVGFAILCRRTPRCAAEDDLVGLLTSLRPADGVAPAPAGRPEMAELTRRADLHLASTDWSFTPSTVAAALESAGHGRQGKAPQAGGGLIP